MINKFDENRDFLQRLLKTPELKDEKRIFDNLLKETTIWWFIQKEAMKKYRFLDYNILQEKKCSMLREKEKRNKCLRCISKNLGKTSFTETVIRFTCPFGLYAITFALDGGKARFFLGICHSKNKIPSLAVENLNTVLRIIVEKVKREQELTKLYETVRPRAIALSTVHTVHRLIGSTLNLEELLPRIARLSAQVLRSKRCIIMLVDESKKVIIPKTFIDMGKKSFSDLKKLHLKSRIEKRVVDSGKVYLNDNRLCVPLIDQEIVGTIRVENKQDNKPFTSFDREILSVLAEQAVVAIRNAQLFEERGRLLLGSIKSLGAILDTRLPNTYTHPIGFVEIILEMGKELRLRDEDMESLKYAALLLDTGKIGIPDEILMKPAKLTGREYGLIKKHPMKGAEIVGSIEAMKPAIPLIMHHHERYDGKGYPMGLKKERIPMGARIIALADAFEAMICKRPYRGIMNIKEAVGEIKESSGTQFDPVVVNAFLSLVKKGKIRNIVCRLRRRGL